MRVERTSDEIDEQVNAASDAVEAGLTNWDGMTYEEGVQNALLWVTGQIAEKPMVE